MKPIKWSYYNDPERRNLYNTIGRLNNLRNNPAFATVFTTGNIQYNLGGLVKSLSVTDGSNSIMVMGNFDVATQNVNVTFPISGTWYNYLSGGSIFASGSNQTFSLAPGEFRVFTNQFVALPVGFLSFTGAHKDGWNNLTWKVDGEQDVLRYELERSVDGINFSAIATLKPAIGSAYSYADNVRKSGQNRFYYRVRVFEKSGAYRYSWVIQLNTNSSSDPSLIISPNPVKDEMTVQLEASESQSVTAEILNANGIAVVRKNIRVNKGFNTMVWDDMAKLSSGIYVLRIKLAEKTVVARLVKVN
jgi:hypothetical protein